MGRKRSTIPTEKQRSILESIHQFQEKHGYPPSIRQICDKAKISSTSVANYHLEQLVKSGYIERDEHVSRGVRLLKSISEEVAEVVAAPVQQAVETIREVLHIPLLGRIAAGQPIVLPESGFSTYDPESRMITVACGSLPAGQKENELFALEVRGDSMIDAMVNDGDIVIMRPAYEARNGDMVAIWLSDEEETTLKFFYHENGKVRLQPANPTIAPTYIDDPRNLRIQGKVVMVIRQLEKPQPS